MKRLLILGLAVLIVCGVAFAGREADPRLAALALCTPKPTLDQRLTMIASRAGSIVPALNKPLPYDKIEQTIRGAWWTVGHKIGVFGAAAQGNPTPDPVMEPVDCSTILDPCAVPQGLGGNAALSGAELAADALRRAGFDPKEIPTFVAIADAESGFNPKAWNNYGAGMAGMWQLNQAYWKLPNWQDPYANAVMAKKVRDESVARGRSPYEPWSTWRTAVANASRYAALSSSQTPNTNPPVTAAISDTPACDPVTTGGGGPGSVGQWNVLALNASNCRGACRNPARINAAAGFADLVCLNEVRDNKALRVPGYQVSPGSMAVPIIWKPSALDKVELHRTTVLTGYARDKSAVWGVWRNRATGKEFGAICTHMLVQGGSGWQKQARNVNAIRARLVARGLPVIVLADMNAPESKVLNFFSGKPVGGRIDFVVGYGMKPEKMETLSNAGSDHARRRWTFPPEPASSAAASIGAGADHLGGGSAPSRFDQQGNPRTVEQAIAWLLAHPNGAPGEPVQGKCERFMNLSFGLSSGYDSAIAHWNAPGPKSTEGTPPRGALTFWGATPKNPYGHVALSVGGDRVISTDFDGHGWAPGRISEGPLDAITFGPLLGWRAPNFKVDSGQ